MTSPTNAPSWSILRADGSRESIPDSALVEFVRDLALDVGDLMGDMSTTQRALVNVANHVRQGQPQEPGDDTAVSNGGGT